MIRVWYCTLDDPVDASRHHPESGAAPLCKGPSLTTIVHSPYKKTSSRIRAGLIRFLYRLGQRREAKLLKALDATSPFVQAVHLKMICEDRGLFILSLRALYTRPAHKQSPRRRFKGRQAVPVRGHKRSMGSFRL